MAAYADTHLLIGFIYIKISNLKIQKLDASSFEKYVIARDINKTMCRIKSQNSNILD